MPRLIGFALSAIFAVVAPNAGAQANFPSKPIKFVVPSPPGGPTDLPARLIAQEMQKTLGQPVVIDNKPGGGTNIGSDFVAKSPPDGYTILMGSIAAFAINQSLYKSLPFDPVKDFAPVSEVVQYPLVLVVNLSLPANNLREFIDYAKANPRKLNRASGGSGSSMHLAGEMFQNLAGLDLPHVPYKGSVQALGDVVGGQVQLMFDSIITALPLVRGGKLRALGVTGATRSPALPDVPTIAEQGFPGFSAVGWNGVLVPANTPPEIVARLNKAITLALKDPTVVERLSIQGAEPVGSTPEEFAAFMQAETRKWAKVVRDSGARAD